MLSGRVLFLNNNYDLFIEKEIDILTNKLLAFFAILYLIWVIYFLWFLNFPLLRDLSIARFLQKFGLTSLRSLVVHWHCHDRGYIQLWRVWLRDFNLRNLVMMISFWYCLLNLFLLWVDSMRRGKSPLVGGGIFCNPKFPN